MAGTGNITAANAVLILSVPLLLPVPTQIQGFETDDIFETEDVEPVETRMGVDGFFVGGFVYTQKPMVITLSPASPSNAFFDAWQAGQQAGLFAAPATGLITLTAISSSYVLTTGFLTRYRPIADGKRVLAPRKFRITWADISAIPIGLGG